MVLKKRNVLYRFVVWNDLHSRADLPGRPPWYPGANIRALWARDQVLKAPAERRPAFVLSAGDIIDGEIPDYNQDFRYVKETLLDPLPVPFLPCLGNHENGQGEGIEEKNKAYDAWFGPGWHNYVFRAGGLGFVVLDTSGGHRSPDGITEARNQFLERSLRFLKEEPIIVVSHTPLIAMREEEVLRQSFGFDSWKVQDERLLGIVESAADRVVAVICGHLHLSGIKEKAGIYHIMAAGTGGYPADLASVTVYEDRIEVTIDSLPAELQNPDANIHGRPRHPTDFTDSDHPDHESYLKGHPWERRILIPLKRSLPVSENLLEVYHETECGQWEKVLAFPLKDG
ncbi:MAG: metallophosphoesterase [Armatimonadetes bacterium]|nr:metallophosphoesterase [Armatimonadota bacterium]